MRALYVTAKDGQEPLVPREIAERLKSLFDNLTVDEQAAAEMCQADVQKYSEYFQKKGWPVADTVESLRQRWKGALVIHGWNDDAENEKFRAILRNQDNFILHFFARLSWPVRRRIAKRIAHVIDYGFALGEEW